MTKKNLLDLLSAYPDDAEVVIEVHDTALHEDLYDFTLDPIQWTRFDFNEDSHETMHELVALPNQKRAMTIDSHTDLDIRMTVSDCFNANHISTEVKSAYQHSLGISDESTGSPTIRWTK